MSRTGAGRAQRVLAALGLVGLLSACASAPQPRSTPASPLLQRISATATGDFASSLEETDPARLLTVAAEPLIGGGNQLILNLVQQEPGVAARRFRLALRQTPDTAAYPLEGVFAPLDGDGRVVAECPLVVRTGAQGLSASTEVESCRFGSGDEQIGLAKELLFGGDQVRVADRLVRGSGLEAETISLTELRFYRLIQYTGWVGVREGEQWRIARDLRLDTANDSIEPVDAAGMSLGLLIQLDHVRMEDSGEPIVRLSVIDAQEERTLGRAWSEPGAARIGLATPTIQVGLERLGSR
ncbi:hypothetical protein AY599_28370 [Leptolyngbya valderiana BDU 20041]|nr:hypothetical protein AY599_28370 [Leptolyngbya valderiana BDU 20041]